MAGFLIPTLKKDHPSAQELHDEMVHAEMALVAGGTLAGDEPE
jgi:hypothetical protein